MVFLLILVSVETFILIGLLSIVSSIQKQLINYNKIIFKIIRLLEILKDAI